MTVTETGTGGIRVVTEPTIEDGSPSTPSTSSTATGTADSERSGVTDDFVMVEHPSAMAVPPPPADIDPVARDFRLKTGAMARGIDDAKKGDINAMFAGASDKELRLMLPFLSFKKLFGKLDNINHFVEGEHYGAVLKTLCEERANVIYPKTLTRIIQALEDRGADRFEEAHIITLLQGCSAERLNAVLSGLDLSRLFKCVNDHAFGGPDHRSELRKMLCDTRLSELEIGVKTELISALLSIPTHRAEEANILNVLATANGKELNLILSTIDLSHLLKDVNDRWIGPDNRTALIKFFSGRADQMTMPVRHRVMLALMESKLSDVAQKCVHDMFLATKGEDLTKLKNMLDLEDSGHDLHSLVFKHIKDEGLKSSMLEHFRTQSGGVREGHVKVYTEVGGSAVKATKADKRYPSGATYPGARQFYSEVFASNGRTLTADKSMEKIDAHKDLWPEYGVVIVCDSAGDSIAKARSMVEAGSPKMKGVFVNDVTGIPEAERRELKAAGIDVFDTYIGAALAAQDRGIIDKAAMRKIAKASIEQFHKVKFGSSEGYQARRPEFDRDVGLVNKLLPSHEDLTLLDGDR